MPEDTGAAPAELSFCSDAELAYRRSLTAFEPGAALTLDDHYRLAHLPLVAPDHPRIIASQPGRDYEMGRHAAVFSVVLPVDGAALQGSPAFVELEAALKASSFAGKIAWDLLPRRSDKLHATIAGSLSIATPPVIDASARAALAKLGPVAVELRGLFSGTINRGRLYLRAYPERRDGRNLFHAVQDALGRPRIDLYVVGVYNLTDDLDAAETLALADLVAQWWDRPLLRIAASELWLLAARDDLVLDSTLTERLALTP